MTQSKPANDALNALLQELDRGMHDASYRLNLKFSGRIYEIRCNDRVVRDRLADYFSEHVPDSQTPTDQVVGILQGDYPLPDLVWADWLRETGKSGRKDAYHDLPGSRLLRKVRTGMHYWQRQQAPIAFGPCRENESQVINFILNQHMSYLQNEGSIICHAAAVSHQDQGLALCAFSGGGKSTLALTLMNQGIDFVSNDRLFIRRGPTGARLFGVAKQPRINPGTILNNPRLTGLLPETRRAELESWPRERLWALEEKYDAPIGALYGVRRFKDSASLSAVVVLNWRHDSQEPTRMNPVSLKEKPHLLDALMKSPGPFHMDANGRPWKNGEMPALENYLEQLEGIPCYELSGRADFEAGKKHCLALLPPI